MERPNTLLGLTSHLVRSRWQQLSSRGRIAVVGGGLLLSLAGVQGARMAMDGCACAHSCSSRVATEAIAPAVVTPELTSSAMPGDSTHLSAAGAHTDCPYANPPAE